MNDSHLIFDFSKTANIEDWRIVNDDVMGGKSESNFSLNENGHGLFEGDISLINYGGFASVRYDFAPIKVKNHTKVLLKVKGDAKDYQFRIKASSMDYYSYVSTFSTNGEWQEIEIALEEMYPSFRGRKLRAPNFNKDKISGITFLVGNKKEEHFKLLIDKISLL